MSRIKPRESVAAFAEAMERTLRKNDYKNHRLLDVGRLHWKDGIVELNPDFKPKEPEP